MDNNLKHIITNKPSLISDALLLKYSEGTAAPNEQYQVEQYLNEEAMECDALEGIELINNSNETKAITENLKAQLSKLANKKATLKNKRKYKENWLVYVVAISLFLLVIVGFYIVKIKMGQ